VSDAFVAPHLKDTTISLTSANVENVGPESGTEITVNITSSNTTYGALLDPTSGGIFNMPQPGDNTPAFVPGGQTGSDTTIFSPPPPPITETHTQLLGTPVKVNVKIP
jgi:hypothetical protein